MMKNTSQSDNAVHQGLDGRIGSRVGGFSLMGKYKELVLPLIVLVFGLGLVVVLNLYFSERSAEYTKHSDLIGDIGDNALFINGVAQKLAYTPAEDTKTINALIGEMQGYAHTIDESVASLEKYDKKETAMTEFVDLWQIYRTKINKLDKTPESRVSFAKYVYEKQPQIWGYIDDGYEVYLAEIFRYSRYTAILHILTFLSLLGYLAFVMGYAFRRINSLDMEIAVAQKQVDDILNTVSEGLFLIDRNLVLSDIHSKSLERILNKKNLQGKSLHQLLNGAISKDDLEATRLFVEQLYNPWVVEELIQDLNPLKQIKVSQMTSDGFSVPKYLDFNFLRVIEEGSDEVSRVFVSVVDVTKAVELQQNIDKAKERHERELEMIAAVLSVEQDHLVSFIDTTKERIEKINNTLSIQSDASVEILQAKAREAFREMHSLKGEASALGLQAFINIAESQEYQLKKLLERPMLSGDDFLKFTVGLNDLLELVKYVEEVIVRLSKLGHREERRKVSYSESKWQRYFKTYASEIAARHNKQVTVSVSGFDEHSHLEQFGVYKDIAVQFLKNAVVHGIETPQDRLLKGKPPVGQISLKLEKQFGELTLSVEDDGQGIDVRAIRQKAVELGIVGRDKVHTLSNKDLYALLLRTGLSTADRHSEDAGRGMGMSVIWELAKENGGELEINSSPDKYTRMTVNFINDDFYGQG